MGLLWNIILQFISLIIFDVLDVVSINGESTGMPLIHISHVDDFGNDFPEMREEVHLEDFFWTGSGDGPPDYLKKVHTGISKGKDVIVKTETVVATVYVDGNNEIDIPICLDCPPDDGGIGNRWGFGNIPPFNYTTTDRRYWLLTVMSGFYSQKDNPSLEEKLARLYRLAFTRQQSKHLGINGAQKIFGLSVPNRTEKMPSQRESKDFELVDMTSKYVPPAYNTSSITSIEHRTNIKSEFESSSEESDESEAITTTEVSTTTAVEDTTSGQTDVVTDVMTWELLQNNDSSGKLMDEPLSLPLQQLPLQKDDKVRIVIHNVTQMTAEDIEKGKISGLYDEDVNEKIEERPIANQTELIYSVFVNGRPVLAVAAANDMKLVSEAEVVDAIGKDIFMKAEPYLREPQATPLAPATHSSSMGFFASLQNNPALVIVSSVAILLLLLLLLAMLLMGRTRGRQTNIHGNRSSSDNDLLSESQSARATSSVMAIDTTRSTARSRDVGVQNLSFEQDHHPTRSSKTPRIHFPGPPGYDHSPPRRDSLTSTDNTSDSSIYCPINPSKAGGSAVCSERSLDEKATTLFDKHKERHQYDRAEGHEKAIYTAIISEKNRTKSRHKTKRKYLSENRVGSLENSPTQRVMLSSGEENVTDSVDGDDGHLRPAAYDNFERTEAFNPHNNFNRNKLLHQNTFTDNTTDVHSNPNHLTSPEAINEEIIRARKSSDAGSIGSFLSMHSVKAFPKTTLPEPLNKVLEPVFVTYYDDVEEQQQQQQQKTKPTQRKQQHVQRQDSMDATRIATIEGFPSPKVPKRFSNLKAQSDNPDPGVIGPIVWERHKQRLTGNETETDMINEQANSPIRDPAAIRSHYEGLLDGAIQMYSTQDDLPMPLPTRDFINNRRPTRREFRGSSAGVATGYNGKSIFATDRPATAHAMKTPKSNQSTQPSSPTSGAWGGGSSLYGSYSPTIVRPFSAGPIHHHHMEFATRGASRSNLDAAPLVKALQQELRKYNKNISK